MASPQPPNFFLVGAPKSGTTSLYRYLGAHPAIYMSPIKEPTHFAPEVIDYTPRSRAFHDADVMALREYLDGPMTERRDHGIVVDWDDYLRLFANAGEATARGEASGNYLASTTAPAAIRHRIPHARILMILRDPVERAFSQYASALAGGNARGTFGDWIREQERAEAGRSPRFGPLWTGMYAMHLRRYRSVFPHGQVRVHLYEDYRADAPGVLADIFRFLGVEASHAVDTRERHNVTTAPRWPALDRLIRYVRPALRTLPHGLRTRIRSWYRRPNRMRPTTDDRARLIAIYADDIRELAGLTGRDLSAWLRPDAHERGTAR